MKKTIFFSLLGIAAIVFIAAGVANTIGGSFRYGTAPTYYTKLDTVTNTGLDTFYTPINPYRNSVGFQLQANKISGNPAGAYIDVWGSKAPNPGANDYCYIGTDTIRNVSARQNFNHEPDSRYRWYRFTYNGAGTSSVSWIAYCLQR